MHQAKVKGNASPEMQIKAHGHCNAELSVASHAQRITCGCSVADGRKIDAKRPRVMWVLLLLDLQEFASSLISMHTGKF